MCDFKPGDEVVCVKTPSCAANPTVKGQTYTVERVFFNQWSGDYALMLLGVENGDEWADYPGFWGHSPRRFRKVERRNDSLSIEAFLTIKPGQFEEPTRAPAKKRERA